MNQFTRSTQLRILFSQLFNSVALIVLWPTLPATAAIPAAPVSVQRAPIAQLKLQLADHGRYEQLLGLTPYGTAIILSETYCTSNVGDIVQWSVSQGKAVRRAPLTKWIDSYNLRLSLDGRSLVSNNARSIVFFPRARSYRITVLRSSDFKTNKAIALKKIEDSVGYLFLPDDALHVVAKRMTSIGTGKDAYSALDRFEWMNLSTGNVDKKLYYNPARGCDQIRSSPSKKYLACLFTDEYFDLKDTESERYGIVDILDARTGKILWHIQGTAKTPAGDPLFFVSPTQFVSSDTIFNIQTKTARRWNAITAGSRCLAVVPGHSGYALFLSKQGLQLRNWAKGRTIASWPTLTTQGRVFFAPDLEMFAYKQGPSVQFWRFNPHWLR